MNPKTVVFSAFLDYDNCQRDFMARRAQLTNIIDQAGADGDEELAALATRLLPVLVALEAHDRQSAGDLFAQAVSGEDR